MNIKVYIEKIKSGETTSYETTEMFLRKIEEKKNLRAVIDVNIDALQEAKNIDSWKGESKLFGLPILIKDNINTFDGTATSAGSIALANNYPNVSAPMVTNLIDAGAVILGKTNMTEFANYMVDYRDYQGMPNGYSSRGGQCVHPLELELGSYVNPSGSSTGSAVAVATGQAMAAIGTETYGSIISPSQKLGIVGIKPTAGSIDMSDVIPISQTLDIAGPMTTCVNDAAIIMGVMHNKTYDVVANKTANIGIYHCSETSEEKDIIELNRALIEKLSQAGAIISDKKLEPIDESCVFDIMRYEFKSSINKYLKECVGENTPKTLSDIIKYNEKNSEIALKYGQNNLIAANAIGEDWQTNQIYVSAIKKRNDAIEAFDKYFEENKFDIVLVENAHCGLAAITGFPSMTLPIGKDKQGHPVGCCIVARRNREDVLINVAKAIEELIS